MDPRGPSKDSDTGAESAAHAPRVARDQGLTPASSLMSIQVRRRTPPRDRRPSAPVTPQPKTPPPAPPIAAKPPATPELAPQRVPPGPPPAPLAPAPQAPASQSPAPQPPAPHAPASAPPARREPTVAATRSAALQVPGSQTPAPQTAPSRPPSAQTAAATGRLPVGDPGRRQPSAAAPASTPAVTDPDLAWHGPAGAEGRGAETMPVPPAVPTKPATPAPPAVRHEPAAPAPVRRAAVTAPSPRREAVASPAAPAAAVPEVRRPEGIVSYWLRLRGSRRLPSIADLDLARVAAEWPNSILMRCRAGSKVLEPQKVFNGSSKLAAAGETAVDMSPMMLQWLLTLAGDAARDRRPMQDTEAFPSRNKSVRYGAFALPFSDDQTRIDHVLCHVYQAG